jgi:mannose-6-phosphate isomerase-like protein (cupin superfamily)
MDGLWACDAVARTEFGVDLRRLFPWSEAPFATTGEGHLGGAWATVPPGGATAPHAHGEAEVFVILSGCGRIHVGGESREVGRGDVVRLPSSVEHTLQNLSVTSPLEFLALWWEMTGRRQTHDCA